jgi:hypothetical protein
MRVEPLFFDSSSGGDEWVVGVAAVAGVRWGERKGGCAPASGIARDDVLDRLVLPAGFAVPHGSTIQSGGLAALALRTTKSQVTPV